MQIGSVLRDVGQPESTIWQRLAEALAGRRPPSPLLILILMAAFIISHLTIVAFFRSVPQICYGLDDILFIASSGLATLCLAYAAAMSAPGSGARRTWALLAAAQLINTLGDLAWMIIEAVFHQNPFPSAADDFYLLFYPLFLAAAVLFLPSAKMHSHHRTTMLIDMAIIMIASVLIFWILLSPLAEFSGGDLYKLALSAAYPVMDLVALWALLELLFRRMPSQNRPSLMLLAVSTAIFVVVDAIFAVQSLENSYISTDILDSGWLICYGLIGLAGILQAHSGPVDQVYEPDSLYWRRGWARYIPYAGICAAYFLIILSANFVLPIPFSVLTLSVGAVIGLTIVRQVIALDENTDLYLEAQREIDERKRAEERMYAAHQQMTDIIEFLPDATLVIDLSGRAIAWNRAMAEMTGVGPEKILGKGDYEYSIPFYGSRRPMLADLVLKPDDEMLKSYGYAEMDGQVLIAGFFVPRLGNGGMHIWGQATPLRDSSGKITGAIETLRDITEHRLTEETLRSSELRFRTLFEEALNPIFVVDLSQKFIGANRAGLEFLECSLDDLQSKNVSDYCSAGLLEEEIQKHRQGISEDDLHGDQGSEGISRGHTLEVECVISGRTKTLLLNVVPLAAPGETVLICIGQDITKRKQAELKLLQSEKKFRGIVENSQDGIALADELGRIVEWNRGFEAITGLSRSSVLGQFLWDVMSMVRLEVDGGFDKAAWKETISEILRTGMMPDDGRLLEVAIRTGEGERKILQSQTFTIGTEKGFMMGIVSRDATQWKNAQEDLRKARDMLEIKVAERTFQLEMANEILQAEITERMKAGEMLKASLNDKEVLLREVHHRVKNNLQVISSLLYLQSRKVDDPHISAIFKESQNRIKSMALIHEKLYRSGNLARIDFSEYARYLISSLFESYGVSQSRISLKMDMEPVLLGVDTAVPCGLIINELISNSLKHAFTDCGHGEIEVSLKSDPSGKLILIIRDNGAGLPGGFDISSSDTLGLQLVKTLVAQIDGQIEVKCENGTEFKISFEELKYKDRG